MGNSIGPALDGNCTTVMKISGETLKLRTPVLAREVLVDYPGYALLESESVKQFGIRAKPLDIYQHLEPKKLYFLIELRKYLEEISRQKMAGSETTMNKTCAKDRLESLMLARRSISSDPSTPAHSSNTKGEDILEEAGDGGRKLKVRLSKEEFRRLVRESKDESELAMKIMDLYDALNGKNKDVTECRVPQVHQEFSHSERVGQGIIRRRQMQKKVMFLPVSDGRDKIVASS